MAAQALSHKTDINHIYSNSWGPEDDGLRKEGPGPLTDQAIRQAILNGRNKKGSLYVWAAGNGKQNGDNCNYDGYANSRFVATFGAVDNLGQATDYSEPCSALIGVLPSGSTRDSMQTTGLMDPNGANTIGDCNVKFSGTSAAAPIAAGIAALMLEVNSDITWLDFQYILKLSAKRNDPSHSSWHQNGAGFWVSHVYGFGIIDADKAVTLALRWKEKQKTSIQELQRNYYYPDKQYFQPCDKEVGGGKIQSEILIKDIDKNIFVHHIEVIINIKHKRRGDLEIKLTSPYGTESILAEQHRDANSNYTDWKFSSLQAWGEGSVGTWALTIIDKNTISPDEYAVLIDWTLNLYGISNFTVYKDLYDTEESSVWDFRGEPIDQFDLPDGNSDWLQNVCKIGLMVTLICGIFLVVVIFIVIFIVKREKGDDKNSLQMYSVKPDDTQIDNLSESSNSL
jgi:subtilisin-like proprotein convertase family protein